MLSSARLVQLADGRRLRVFDSRPSGAADARGDAGAPLTPLIVLEPGLGAPGRSWAGVFHRLAPFARVIAYDRAGYGGSDPAPTVGAGRPLAALRDDLLAVISDAEGDHPGAAPVVLVGHSWGGPIVRAATAARLAAGLRVDGLVLADPSDEHCELYFGPTAAWIDRLQARLLVPLARWGLLAPLARSAYAGLPHRQRVAAAADGGTVAAARAASAETTAFGRDLAGLRDAAPDLGTVPVRILSGVRADLGVRAMRDGLRAAHLRSAALAADGAFLDAPASAHGVPFTDARLVADTALALARS